jgi:hypothetical protein
MTVDLTNQEWALIKRIIDVSLQENSPSNLVKLFEPNFIAIIKKIKEAQLEELKRVQEENKKLFEEYKKGI